MEAPAISRAARTGDPVGMGYELINGQAGLDRNRGRAADGHRRGLRIRLPAREWRRGPMVVSAGVEQPGGSPLLSDPGVRGVGPAPGGTRHQLQTSTTQGGTLSGRLITGAGFARATEMLEHLKTTGRREIAERLRDVITSETNAADSADYLDAREDQLLLERKIAQLEQRLANARVAEPDGANGVIDLGERVRLRDLETGERVEYDSPPTFDHDHAPPSRQPACAPRRTGWAPRGRRRSRGSAPRRACRRSAPRT